MSSLYSLRSSEGIIYDQKNISFCQEAGINQIKENSCYHEMVLIEKGTLTMGKENEKKDSSHVHKVIIDSFLIGKFTVIQSLWENVMGYNPSRFRKSNHPVEKVSWYDALLFCNKLSASEGLDLCYQIDSDDDHRKAPQITQVQCFWDRNGYRLPTEAEWEYAAKGADSGQFMMYAGSDSIEAVAKQRQGLKCTDPVGMKLPNNVGLFDMSGNVFEWCWDWYDSKYYEYGTHINPRGAETGTFKIARGGSWISSEYFCRVYARYSMFPDLSTDKIGLRLSRSII